MLLIRRSSCSRARAGWLRAVGSGIEHAQMDRIFEPLFSTKNFGVGLGLPLVKRVAEEHGGRVDVDSTVNKGTTVSILLPLADMGDESAK